MAILPALKSTPTKSGKTRKKQRRWLLAGLIVLVLGGTIAGLGYYYFPKFNEQRLLRKARVFLAAKDYQSAAITVQRALQHDDRNVAAVRLLVEITSAVGSPAVLTWKRRLVEIKPDSLEDRLSLAETALDLGQPAMAEEALVLAPESAKDQARFHALMARAAQAGKAYATVEKEFAEAARLEPANETYQLEWRAAQLQSKDSAVRGQAREALAGMLGRPAIFGRVSRLLIDEARSRSDMRRALEFADALQKADGASFDDRLVYLDLLHLLKLPNYPTYLATLQEESVADPSRLATLMGWLNDRRSALLVVDWAKRLPPEVLTAMPVPVALAQSHLRLRNWAELRPLVTETTSSPGPAANAATGESTGKWGDFEFLRLAYLAALHRAEGDHEQAKVRWTGAVRAASNRPAAIEALARYSVEWGWEGESAELLWKVARSSPNPMWALRILYRTFEELKSTANLRQVAERILEIQPSSRDMINNLAMLDLLLGKKVAEAVESIRDLQRNEPQNPDYLSTYSLGLFMQGYTKDAAELWKALDPEKLKQPNIAAYYGLILSATDAKEEARKYLEIGKDAKLLPEEKRLIAQAWQRLNPSAAPEVAPEPTSGAALEIIPAVQ